MVLNRFRVVLLVICTLQRAAGQPGQLSFSGEVPQAHTEGEFDEWLEIVRGQTPSSIVHLVQEFLKRYPDSDFQPAALQCEIKAWQDLDRVPETIEPAKQLLRLRPNSIEGMIALARALPEIAKDSGDPLLDSANGYADQALAQLATQRIPRSLTPERWNQLCSEMEGEIHLARARVAEKHGNIQEAIKEARIVLDSGFSNLEEGAKRELRRLGQPDP